MNIAIIPARSGSKGVPNKNIRDLGGKPVIHYTISAAQESKMFDEIFLSTDTQEIADIGHTYNLTIPFLRPTNLALDTTPMLDVIQHVIAYYHSIKKYPKTIVLLQPTCPFRTAEDIKDAVTKFNASELDSLLSVKRVPDHFNPHWVYKINDSNVLELFTGEDSPITRRQQLPITFIREGSIYIFRIETLQQYENIYGSKIGYFEITHQTVNIDTIEDFVNAEILMQKINTRC